MQITNAYFIPPQGPTRTTLLLLLRAHTEFTLLLDGISTKGGYSSETRKETRFFAPWEVGVLFHHRFCKEGTSSMAWSQAYDTLRWAFLRGLKGRFYFSRGILCFSLSRGQVYALRREMKRSLPTNYVRFSVTTPRRGWACNRKRSGIFPH